ncbi:DUF362 domain-containing protein [Pacificimonas sp. WHA3]|uniref:DUF362 domain-containing protein n=1 Tax=Pacificimonas pallii TaxID=2827236 RepID=A0ABS6SIU7_9SPHN|nr:DUF362 domain-containing protein [Pacificimonas pallii]MBV7257792.1 DUF362 domain-containing protein [Pacificimonas pallii]
MTTPPPAIAVVTDAAAQPAHLLDRAAAAISLDRLVRAALKAKDSNRQVVIVPAMAGFAKRSPAMTDPALVEHLADHLYALGADSVVIGTTESSDAMWAENRDVFMRADLLGYRYVTPAGRDYDIVDLSEDAEESPFPEDGVLCGVPLSAIWQNAAFRIVFAANRTDVADGFALTLGTLLSVLPGRDKDSLYVRQRNPGAVVRALLAAAPVDLALIDGCVSSHGEGGCSQPLPLDTHTIIVARDPYQADQVGALKMGLDPNVSRLWQVPGDDGDAMIGSLRPYADWINVSPRARDAARRRQKDAALDRSAIPVLQAVDEALFPFRNEANARLNGWLRQFLSADAAPGRGTYALLGLILAQLAEARTAWQTMFAKDAIIRSPAALNVRAENIDDAEWRKIAPAIARQRALLRGCIADEEGLRWRMIDDAVLFDCVRRFPLPLGVFAAAVPVNRTIQFMNDYIGGEALTVARDTEGRVTRQLERNLYLPQPNFTALLGGSVIDVTKIETIRYGAGRQSMAWQTLFSENDSALADDGLVEFAGVGDDTVVTIFARQHFRQPALVEAIDLSRFPALHDWLVTDAYRRFASRTFANLEAVLEGRDVRIGKPAARIDAEEPLPVDSLAAIAERLRDDLPDDWIEALRSRVDGNHKDQPVPTRIDADGLRHFSGRAGGEADVRMTRGAVSGLLNDMTRAVAVDLGIRS